MNLFLPRDYSAVRVRVDEAFSLRRLTAKIIGEIDSISTLTAAIASGDGRHGSAGICRACTVQCGKWLDGADHDTIHELTAVAEHVSPRFVVTAGAGGKRNFDVSGEQAIAGKS
jgi:hypothetical protein